MPRLTPRTGMPALWHDWLEDQQTPCRLLTPKDRHELVALLKSAVDLRQIFLKGCGGLHSSSPVARPKPHGYSVQFGRFELDHEAEAPSWLRADAAQREPQKVAPDATLVRVSANEKISSVNARLAAMNPARALLNLGSYDAQSVYGAVSTATHGSGMASGPLCDFVSSLEMVSIEKDAAGNPKVSSYRIEPSDGITDKAKFDAAAGLHGMELIQNDQVFYSAVVSMGCFGIVTALTLQVVPAFSLRETRSLAPWSAAKADIAADSDHPYFDLTLTALIVRPQGPNEHRCLKTFRTKIDPDPLKDAPERKDARVDALKRTAQDHAPRHDLTEYLAGLGSLAPRTANYQAWQSAFVDEVDRYAPTPFRARSHVTFRTSIGDYVFATSAEVVVPKVHAAAAVDAAIAHSRAMHETGYHHLSPYGIRFVKASRHYLAPEYDQDSCTVEAPILLGARKRHQPASESPGAIDHMLRAYVDRYEAAPYTARWHWGQRNYLTYADVKRQYPRFESCWMVQYERFNAFGNFNNAFTDQLGISR